MSVVLKSAARLPFAPIVAAFFAVAVAILVVAMPTWMLEYYAARTGLTAVLPAAQPPLGQTARLALVALGALGTGLVTWLAMIPVGKWLDRSVAQGFDAVPLSPATENDSAVGTGFNRPPIFADRDLGSPFMSEDVAATESQSEVVAPVEELVLENSHVADEALTELVVQDAVVDDAPPVAEPVASPAAMEVIAPIVEAAPMAAPQASINDMMSRLEVGVTRRSGIRALVQSHEANDEAIEPIGKIAKR
ncbi:MAG: hypothetical protein ABL918_06525 [Chakrabartia sp.]